MLTRRLFLAGLVALGAVPGAFAQASLTRQRLSAILREGSPTGWRIVDGYERAGTTFGTEVRQVTIFKVDMWTLVEGRPGRDLLTAANILVHESCHFYSVIQALDALSGAPGNAYFPDTQSIIVVPETQTFPAREAVASCPDFLRETVRYGTYFDSDSPILSTQKSGIYGLMNELGAYYCGTMACVELLSHMVKAPRGYPPNWERFLTDPMQTMMATQEFRGYILAYLDHARTAHPKIYAEVLANHSLWQAYHAIQSAHAKLADNYFRQLRRLAAKVGAKLRGDNVEVGGVKYPIGRTAFSRLRSKLDASPHLRAVEMAIQQQGYELIVNITPTP